MVTATTVALAPSILRVALAPTAMTAAHARSALEANAWGLTVVGLAVKLAHLPIPTAIWIADTATSARRVVLSASALVGASRAATAA